jgi:hypothetical protein
MTRWAPSWRLLYCMAAVGFIRYGTETDSFVWKAVFYGAAVCFLNWAIERANDHS